LNAVAKTVSLVLLLFAERFESFAGKPVATVSFKPRLSLRNCENSDQFGKPVLTLMLRNLCVSLLPLGKLVGEFRTVRSSLRE